MTSKFSCPPGTKSWFIQKEKQKKGEGKVSFPNTLSETLWASPLTLHGPYGSELPQGLSTSHWIPAILKISTRLFFLEVLLLLETLEIQHCILTAQTGDIHLGRCCLQGRGEICVHFLCPRFDKGLPRRLLLEWTECVESESLKPGLHTYRPRQSADTLVQLRLPSVKWFQSKLSNRFRF